jgi:hypothetical protein
VACGVTAGLGAFAAALAFSCTPTQRQTISADLPAIEQATMQECAIVETATCGTPACPYVDLICLVLEGGEHLLGAALPLVPIDAGATQTAVILHDVARADAVAMVRRYPHPR